jgi:hypothetical protein
MRRLFGVGVFIATLSTASAAVITLTPVEVFHQLQQLTNEPCIIGDPSCHNGGFPETIFPAGVPSYDALSPLYTVADIRAAAGNIFVVGVDVNQNNTVQTLSLFAMLINGLVIDSYSPGFPTAVPPTPGGGNGNGYADYILSNFSSLAAFAAADTVQFHAIMPVVNAGREQFFLQADAVIAPEPVTMSLVGSGLIVLGLFARRRRPD